MVWNYGVFFFSLSSILSFSVVLYSSVSLVIVWLCLELVSLSVLPVFFIRPVSKDVFSGLFYYFIISCLSSFVVITGFIFSDLWLLSFVGVLVKLGVFPFFWWVYRVVGSSNWLVVWELSTLLKFPVFLIPFLFDWGEFVLAILVCVMFIFLGIFFWLYSYSWFNCWTHMMLASTALLVSVSLNASLDFTFSLFVVYFVWASMVLFFVSRLSNNLRLSLGSWYSYCFLLVSYPLSASLFYKLVMLYGVSSCCVGVVISWLIYSLSEQVFLIVWAVNDNFPRNACGFASFL